ncbi:MAG: filamentous hemagglutinin N-terminal domain-containing protein [Cyanobacteria bacterium J06598_3]
MIKKYGLILGLTSAWITFCGSVGRPAKGEFLGVVTDGTTLSIIAGNAQCTANCIVSGGARLGNNTFHSFEEFSIPENITVTFEDDGATNIFTRVSGSTSLINGTLAVSGNGSANFFLINPNGITFGPQAALISSGAFIASSADHIVFSDSTVFSATETTPPILTISAPIGFQLGANPGAIIHRSQASLGGNTNALGEPAGLQVSEGETLALIGSSIFLDGGNLTAQSGRVKLGSVTGNSYVSLSPAFRLGYTEASFQDIQLTGNAVIDASGNGGGIALQGRNISIGDLSLIANLNLGSSSAGSIQLIADDSIDISGLGIFSTTFPGSVGDSADIDIRTRTLRVSNGGAISGGTGGQGNGGRLTIQASEAVEVNGSSGFSPSLITTATDGPGTGGTLTINTHQLSVTDGGQVQAVTFGPGKGGDLVVNAAGRVDASGTGETIFVEELTSGLLASSGLEGLPFQPTGEGGNLTINTGLLNLNDGGQVAVNSLGSGNSGSLEVNARRVRLDNNAQLTAAAAFGNGGNIRLNHLETLVLRRGSAISTQAGTGDGNGNGGNITIDANFVVTNPLENSDIIAKATQGRGGNIEIDTLALYGIEERRASAGNDTNDIDASSDFGVSGTIAINRLIEDTDQGLVSLSDSALETTSAVSQGCGANGNRLVITRRGGLPTHPNEPTEALSPLVDLGRGYFAGNFARGALAPSSETLASDNLVTSHVTPNRDDAYAREVLNNHLPAHNSTELTNTDPESAVEAALSEATQAKATGWVEASHWQRDDNNRVVLSAQNPSETLVALQAASHCTQ